MILSMLYVCLCLLKEDHILLHDDTIPIPVIRIPGFPPLLSFVVCPLLLP